MTGGMMFKGTPGPWGVAVPIGAASTVPRPIAFIVGPTMVVHGDGRSLGYKPEDANLIAAAPDLLEALIRLEKATRILPPHFDEKDSPFYQASAAIAKALGEQK